MTTWVAPYIAADELGISTADVRYLMDAGRLPSELRGFGERLCSREGLDAYIAEHPVMPRSVPALDADVPGRDHDRDDLAAARGHAGVKARLARQKLERADFEARRDAILDEQARWR